MRHRSLLPTVLLLFALQLHAKEVPVPTSIQAVKVFLSGAEVTRTGKVSLPLGASTLLFSGLSEEVDPNNIEVNGKGSFTILSVSHRLNYAKEQEDRKEVKDMEEKLAALQGDIAKERALLGVLGKEEERLVKNDVVGGDKGATLEQLRATNDYMQQRLEAIALASLGKEVRIKDLNEQLVKVQLQLTQVKGKKPAPTSEVVVEVTCSAPVEAKLTLKYLVKSAGWSPSYDIRVDDISQPLGLTYKALVYQNSGEDWKDVVLALSSGDPSKGAVMPMLSTWLLGFGRPQVVLPRFGEQYRPEVRDVRGIVRDEKTDEPLPFVTVQLVDADGNMINGTTTNMDGYYAIAIPENGHELRFSFVGYKTQGATIQSGTMNQRLTPGAELSSVEVVRYKTPLLDRDEDVSRVMGASPGVQYMRGARTSREDLTEDNGAITTTSQSVIERATNFEFAIDVPYSIPSDGQSHNVGVKEQKLTAQYRYYCTPKLDLDAFLFAKVTNWETLNLLPGPANIYFEGTYVGESQLDVSAVGDTLDLSLGRDQGVTVQRTKRTDFSKKQTIGSKRTDSVSWELAVRNNKTQPVELTITDQYPVAARSEIEVELPESSNASVNKEKGFLTWKRSIEAHTNQQWTFTYSVKYPKEGLVVLE